MAYELVCRKSICCRQCMGGYRIFDWGGQCIDEARDAGQNVAIFSLKSWPIGADMRKVNIFPQAEFLVLEIFHTSAQSFDHTGRPKKNWD